MGKRVFGGEIFESDREQGRDLQIIARGYIIEQ